MRRIKVGYLLLLISSLLAGCDSVQTTGQIKELPQNEASENLVQKDSNTPDKILFKGNSMTLIYKEQNVFKRLPFDSSKKSCLNKAEENLKTKLPELGFNSSTEYLEFEVTETNSFGADKFTVNIDKHLFSKTNPDSLKNLDKYVGFTDSRNLYLLKNDNISYLLLIGHESATSGLGHFYRTHLLVPIDSDRTAIEFQSISDDPRRIRIADSGAIYYVLVDLDNDSIEDPTSTRVPLEVSLYSVDSANNKRLETKFDLKCENMDKIFGN